MPTERDYERVIKTLNAAYDAMGRIMSIGSPGDDSRAKLRRDIAEYAGYLEHATWWRTGKGKARK